MKKAKSPCFGGLSTVRRCEKEGGKDVTTTHCTTTTTYKICPVSDSYSNMKIPGQWSTDRNDVPRTLADMHVSPADATTRHPSA
jgi:hypothetical protein